MHGRKTQLKPNEKKRDITSAHVQGFHFAFYLTELIQRLAEYARFYEFGAYSVKFGAYSVRFSRIRSELLAEYALITLNVPR